MIVDKKGYIVANNHVVNGSNEIQVQLNGESARYTAKVVRIDEETDLAVLKIEVGTLGIRTLTVFLAGTVPS